MNSLFAHLTVSHAFISLKMTENPRSLQFILALAFVTHNSTKNFFMQLVIALIIARLSIAEESLL
jgi:hypothetical protein